MKQNTALITIAIFILLILTGCGTASKQQYPYMVATGDVKAESLYRTQRPVEYAVDDMGIVSGKAYEVRRKGIARIFGTHLDGDRPGDESTGQKTILKNSYATAGGEYFDYLFIDPSKKIKQMQQAGAPMTSQAKEVSMGVGKIYLGVLGIYSILPVYVVGKGTYYALGGGQETKEQLIDTDPLTKIAIQRAIDSKSGATGLFMTSVTKEKKGSLFTEKISISVSGHALEYKNLGPISQDRWDAMLVGKN